jgi:lipopolysaccharide biosynthesis glycosyltransferase
MTWHVACAADEAYIGHCAAMAHSLLAANPHRDVVVHLLHPPELPAGCLTGMDAVVTGNGGTFEPIAIGDGAVADLPAMSRIPRVMWFRVFLPDLLPAVDRVLYLDADTLVVDDLSALWDQPLDDAHVAAVANVLEPQYATHPADLGLPADQRYFNSGVLLLNLARMRAEDCTARIVRYAQGQQLLWPDQDALNVVLGPAHVDLHPRWNAMNSLFVLRQAQDVFGAAVVDEACRDPAIVHFEGPEIGKPWHYLSKHPFRAEYLAHRAQTPWPAAEVVGRTLPNRLLKPLPTRAALEVIGRYEWLRAVVGSRVRGLRAPRRAG